MLHVRLMYAPNLEFRQFNTNLTVPLRCTAAEWLDNLQVFVGNCRPDDITDNNMRVCDDDIDDVADMASSPPQKGIVEVSCDNGAYGRYVYLIPNVDTNPFQVCEVRIYGSDSKLIDCLFSRVWDYYKNCENLICPLSFIGLPARFALVLNAFSPCGTKLIVA